MRTARYIAGIMVGMLLVHGAVAEPIDFRRDYALRVLDHTAGIPHLDIASLAFPEDGRLWYGAKGSVGTFDGTFFTVPGVPFMEPVQLRVYADKGGRAWVCGRGAMARHQAGGWIVYDGMDDLPAWDVISVGTDGDGHLWAGGPGYIVKMVGDRFGRVAVPEAAAAEELRVVIDGLGRPWCATGDYVGWHEGGRWHRAWAAAPMDASRVMGVTGARAEGVWVGMQTEVRLLRRGAMDRAWPRQDNLRGDALALLEDSRGNLWVGGTRSGLTVFNPQGEATRLTVRDGLPGNSVSAVGEDGEGNVWVAVKGCGLVRLRPMTVVRHGGEEGLMQIANSIWPDGRGGMLVGSHGDGLMTWEGGQFQQHEAWRGEWCPERSWVQSVVRTEAGDIWVGTSKAGLIRFSEGNVEQHGPEDLGADTVHALYEDSGGVIWIGTSGGLLAWQDGRFQQRLPGGGDEPMDVRAIAQDGGGDIWVVVTGKGLWRGRGGVFTPFVAHGMAAPESIRSLLGTRDGSVWVGTARKGLFRVRGSKVQGYGTQEGLPDMEVIAMAEDRSGNLWLGGGSQLVRVPVKAMDDVAAGRLRVVPCAGYGASDGVPGPIRGGRQPSACVDAEGKVWFATLRGFAVVDPERSMAPLPPPQARLISMRVDGEMVEDLDDVGGRLRFPAGSRIEVQFSASRLGTAERLRFQHRMLPDGTWSPTMDHGSAQFGDVGPGRHQFEIRAAELEGLWGPPAVLTFELLPSVWQRGWVRAFAIFAPSIGTAWFVRHLAVARRRRADAREEFTRDLIRREDSWRRRIAADLHDGLGQLLQVMRNRAILATRTTDPGTASGHADAIAQAAGQAIREMREMVGNLHPSHLDHLGLTAAVRQLATDASRAGDTQWESDIGPIDGLLSKDQEVHFYRVVQEALGNVLRHARSPRAWVSVHRDGDVLRASVKDNGPGLSRPGTHVDDARRGFGLRNMEERAAILGGRLHLVSPSEGGLIVCLEVPIPNPAHGTEDANHSRG